MRHRAVLVVVLALLGVNVVTSVEIADAAAPLKWNFNGGLTGWTPGRAGAPGTANWGIVGTEHQGSNGYVRLDGNGDPAHPNAWISKTIDLPPTTRTLRYTISADDVPNSDAGFEVRLAARGETTVLAKGDARNTVPNRLTFHSVSINISRWAGETVTLFFMQNDNGVNGVIHNPDEDEQLYYDNIEIVAPAPTPPPCDIEGIVRDGDHATDGHDNPLVGVPVELVQNGTPVGKPAVTGSDGRYCIPGGVAQPGPYELRASLVDGDHVPPIFVTLHAGAAAPVSMSQDITEADFGRHDLDLTFSASASQPWLADVANIHWQSKRFVDWLVDTLVLDPGALAGLSIDTDTTSGTAYTPSTKTVHIQASDTRFAQRQLATSECPENCEWHEISHHVAEIEGIAPTDTAPACAGRTPHGGWSNDSTCDSLAEGFAMFLPTLASLDIDAGRAGYATADYSVFGSMEAGGDYPWTSVGGIFREDLAVTELLWDLADDTKTEVTSIAWEQRPNSVPTDVFGHDRVSLGGVKLVQLLILAKPSTVADIYDFLSADPGVPADLKVPDLDVDRDGVPDLSPLGEVFVAHGFYAERPRTFNAYTLGDLVGVTQPGSHNLIVRRHEPIIPGSGIRLTNSTATPSTVSIDVAYPSASSHFEVVLAAQADLVVHLELPPYWAGEAPSDGSLPACANPDAWPVTLTISAPGTTAATVSSCQYLHFVASTSTDSAMTYAIGAGLATPAATAPPATTAGPAVPPSPVGAQPVADQQATNTGPWLVAGAVLLLAGVVVGLGVRRRSRRP